MFQCVVLRSLARLSCGLVTEGHHHGTTVPGPSKSFPLQSCGGVNEHEGLWGPQRWTPTLRVLLLPLQPPARAQAPGLTPARCAHSLLRLWGGLRVRGALWGGAGAFLLWLLFLICVLFWICVRDSRLEKRAWLLEHNVARLAMPSSATRTRCLQQPPDPAGPGRAAVLIPRIAAVFIHFSL